MSDPILIFRPSKIKLIIPLLVSIVFTVIGLGMIDNGEYTGWFVALFFSICTIVFIIIFLPNSSYLRITNQGFEIRSLYKSNFTNWNEVKEFGYGYVGGKKMVVFNYSPSHSKFQTTKNVAKTLTSIEGALPDIYGKSPEELAKLLNELKEEYSNFRV